MSNPAPSHPFGGDPLLQRAVEDWRTVAHGGSYDAFLNDLLQLWRRDAGDTAPPMKYHDEMAALNKELTSQHLLPNLTIFGVRGTHVILEESGHRARYAMLTNNGHGTELQDIDLPVFGDPRPRHQSPPPGGLGTVSPGGVEQGDANGDCKFQAKLASLAQADPSAIVKMIQDNHDGTYTVTFPGDKEHPQIVTEPSQFEIDTFSPGAAEWAAIIGKAYRQRENEPLGTLSEAAQNVDGLLTGKPSALFDAGSSNECGSLLEGIDWVARSLGADSVCHWKTHFESAAQTVDQNKGKTELIDPKDLGSWLQETLANHMIITVGFDEQGLAKASEADRHGTDAQGHRVEVERNHAYSLIGYDPATQMVTLRNPWGKNFGRAGFVGDGMLFIPLRQFILLDGWIRVEATAPSR
jgi:hypothetical protein